MYGLVSFEYPPVGTLPPFTVSQNGTPYHPQSAKSFVALLLQRSLHNSGALDPATHLDRITYSQNRAKTRKSFVALLLPHVFAVSPLLRYSYKKMGGGGPALRNLGEGGPSLVTSHPPLDIAPTSPQCFLSLTKIPQKTPQKSPNVFYHLQTVSPLTTCVFYHLQKRGVGGE
jgi:hypothetical protein